MRRSIFHIIVLLLLSALYMSERELPCVDTCFTPCGASAQDAPRQDHGHHDDAGPGDASHHCDHCACPCHVPAIEPAATADISIPAVSVRYQRAGLYFPSASDSPPDHVPLA